MFDVAFCNVAYRTAATCHTAITHCITINNISAVASPPVLLDASPTLSKSTRYAASAAPSAPALPIGRGSEQSEQRHLSNRKQTSSCPQQQQPAGQPTTAIQQPTRPAPTSNQPAATPSKAASSNQQQQPAATSSSRQQPAAASSSQQQPPAASSNHQKDKPSQSRPGSARIWGDVFYFFIFYFLIVLNMFGVV